MLEYASHKSQSHNNPPKLPARLFADVMFVLRYRVTVFALALGYWLYQFTQTDLDAFGWQFRFLTIWALTANLVVAGQMLRRSLGLSNAD